MAIKKWEMAMKEDWTEKLNYFSNTVIYLFSILQTILKVL